MFYIIVTLIVVVLVAMVMIRIPYAIFCIICLPNNHPRNIAIKKSLWRSKYPNKKSPYRD